MMATKKDETAQDRLALAVTGLEPESAVTLRKAFESMFTQAEEWAAKAALIKVTDVSQTREMKLARESRLALREIRINVEKTRKRLKEDSLRTGKAIDGIANVAKALIEPIEAYLQEQESFADRMIEQEQTQLRTARHAALVAYGVDPSVYADLGVVEEPVWNTILENARSAHEGKQLAAKRAEEERAAAERKAAEEREAERKAAEAREAERAERARLEREENDRRRAEAEERERVARAEREQAERERAAAEAKAREEREARERAEAEIARVKAEEAARVAAEEEARKRAALAPDREKIAAFVGAIRALPVPRLSSPKSALVVAKITKAIEIAAASIEKLGSEL